MVFFGSNAGSNYNLCPIEYQVLSIPRILPAVLVFCLLLGVAYGALNGPALPIEVL
jgi:hypothetical protein